MTDTKERTGLFAVLRRMEADTVRMCDAAMPRVAEADGRLLRRLREGHEAHVLAMQELLGGCEPEDLDAPEDVRRAIEEQVNAVRSASDPGATLANLLDAERTTAAEYAVTESSHLTEDERGEIARLHGEVRDYVRELESRVHAMSGAQ